MLSFQEMVDKTETQRRNLKEKLDSGTWHPEDASIFTELKAADAYEIQQTYRALSLSEFLAKSSTTGIAGAAYLVPDKIHDELIMWTKEDDIAQLVSAYMATNWAGGDLKVDIVDDESYRGQIFVSGGTAPVETVKTGSTTQATLTPVIFSTHIRATNDLIEDAAWSLVEWHVRQAAKALILTSNELALGVLKTAADGIGTLNVNAVTGDADETKWTGGATNDIEDCITALEDDRWIANTMLTTTEAWHNSIQTTYLILASNLSMYAQTGAPALGFDCRLGIPSLDVKFINNRAMHAFTTDTDTGAMTNCVTFVMDRRNALFTGRKRWMQIENYTHPFEDLAGAVVSCRQDSVSLYNDAIAYLYET